MRVSFSRVIFVIPFKAFIFKFKFCSIPGFSLNLTLNNPALVESPRLLLLLLLFKSHLTSFVNWPTETLAYSIILSRAHHKCYRFPLSVPNLVSNLAARSSELGFITILVTKPLNCSLKSPYGFGKIRQESRLWRKRRSCLQGRHRKRKRQSLVRKKALSEREVSLRNCISVCYGCNCVYCSLLHASFKDQWG